MLFAHKVWLRTAPFTCKYGVQKGVGPADEYLAGRKGIPASNDRNPG
jgi:hypothetical protein